jgi:hypothetical protein
MEEVLNSVFNDAVRFWREGHDIDTPELKAAMKKHTVGLNYLTIVEDNVSTENLIILDHFSMKTFRVPKTTFLFVQSALNQLVSYNVFIREGFVDRSLNVDQFARIDQFQFLIGSIELSHNEIIKIVDKFPINNGQDEAQSDR